MKHLPTACALALSLGAAACSTVETALDPSLQPLARSAREGAEELASNGAALTRQAAGAAYHEATGPHLAPVEDPSALAPTPIAMPGPVPNQAPLSGGTAPNALWQAGARTFFNDQRAGRVGDILTVKIIIDDSAQVDNSTSRDRTGSTDVGVSSLFGKEETLGRLLPPGGSFDPASLVSASGDSSASGKGAISRKEKIDLTLAATIAQVLPNGNLVVVGRQQVRVNGELRELTVAGVIRPEDVGADNSIRHDQMAEARISYGGKGTLTAVQKPRWGQRVVDAISPF